MARLIDLTHSLEDGQAVFPGDPEVRIEAAGTVATQRYNLTRLSLGSHAGTHLDAPYHFFEEGRRVDQIDLARLYGPATLVDLAPGSALAAETRLTVEMLARHEGAFEEGARVIYRTGWDRWHGKAEFFEGFPSLTVEAARWIAARKIGLLGMDTPSPSEEWLEVHQVLLAKGVEIVIVESLANLDQLPERFTLAALPLKLRGRDGAPVRAVGICE